MATKARYAELEGKIKDQAAAESTAQAETANAAAAQQRQSAQWIARFRPFLAYPGQEGHDPGQLVFVPGTADPEKFAQAQRRYEAFKAFYAEYRQAEFPNGKTAELEELAERAAPERLRAFEEGFADRERSVVTEAKQQIAAALQQLDHDSRWKTDSAIKPPLIDAKWMASIDAAVANVAAALGEAAPQTVEVRENYAALVAKDRELRALRAARTTLSPSIYAAPDQDELTEKAKQIVVADRAGAKVLKVSLPKDAWADKTVEGWTDTTKTVWQVKTFREINAQVAAKDPTGVYLHAVYLARDKTSGVLPVRLHEIPSLAR